MLELLPGPWKEQHSMQTITLLIQHVSVPQWVDLVALLRIKEAKCLYFTVNM